MNTRFRFLMPLIVIAFLLGATGASNTVYVDGDRFSVLLNADGTLDIYRNGKLFVKRIVMS